MIGWGMKSNIHGDEKKREIFYIFQARIGNKESIKFEVAFSRQLAIFVSFNCLKTFPHRPHDEKSEQLLILIEENLQSQSVKENSRTKNSIKKIFNHGRKLLKFERQQTIESF